MDSLCDASSEDVIVVLKHAVGWNIFELEYLAIHMVRPQIFRRVVLKEYCALHLAADTVTT